MSLSHLPFTLTDKCTVLWNHEDKKVSGMATKTINDETYYKLDDGPLVKVHEGVEYKDGDTFYLKKDCKNEIIKEEYDHWRAMAKIFVFNEDKMNTMAQRRSNNLHIRCWIE